MNITRTGVIVSIGAGSVVIISGIIGAIVWFNSEYVHASDYKEDQIRIQQMQIINQLDIQEDRLRRETDPNRRRELEKRIRRLEGQQKQLDKMELESK